MPLLLESYKYLLLMYETIIEKSIKSNAVWGTEKKKTLQNNLVFSAFSAKDSLHESLSGINVVLHKSL